MSFADVSDVEPPQGVDFDSASIDWDEIREYARVAVQTLTPFADPADLTAAATALIDSTINEMRAPRRQSTATAAIRCAAKTVGLCMIVKNEAPVIRRCLDSVRPIIDHWVIVTPGPPHAPRTSSASTCVTCQASCTNGHGRTSRTTAPRGGGLVQQQNPTTP